MKLTLVAASRLVLVIAASCATIPAGAQDRPPIRPPEYVEPRVYSATEAVRGVASSPTSGLFGQFAFVVKGWGRDDERIFLNSEADYRDAGTLTVALTGQAVAALRAQSGGSPDRLVGRTIVASGVARRARINISENGRATGQFYFQTHVTISQADDIHLVPGPALPIIVSP